MRLDHLLSKENMSRHHGLFVFQVDNRLTIDFKIIVIVLHLFNLQDPILKLIHGLIAQLVRASV